MKNELADEKSNSELAHNDEKLTQNFMINRPIKIENLPNSSNPRKRRISDRKPKVSPEFIKQPKLEPTEKFIDNEPLEDFDQSYTENGDPKKSSIQKDVFWDTSKRTQVILTIDNDNVYQFKIPKSTVCLDDIKKYLMRKPERYSISDKDI